MSKREIANELHKPARKNFTRRRVNVYGKNDLWQADLVEMIPYSKVNGGYKYILVVIDCFTKFSWAKPLKSKTGKEVTSAMATILVKRSPKLLQLYNGKEFYNTTFDALMSKYGIHKYSTFSILKASIAERMNRTLKGRMYKEFTARGSHEWVSILPKLLDEYNNSPHRTIGMTPIQADSDPASVVIKQRKINNEKIKFKVGDKVRISTQKGVFTKGYLPNWSTEIFEIIKINKTLPATYQLQDYMSNPIAGCFYSSEISKTDFPNEYLIEKIIRKKGDQISQVSDTRRIISDIQSSNKTILNDTKLQQKEIDTLKSNIVNLHDKIQLLENNIQTSNKSLLNCENRMSELFNNCAETSTAIAIQGLDVAQLKAEVNRITGIFDENSLPNHGTYISDLNSRLEIIEGKKIKKT
ncbi:uncharacterized protein LOC132953048 [Metopolophium dirhodum]|uniref:uncharacterized protein LOC132953048 n=1 Tax=Metopolophium dirhodum TaxID=44670 RepID=UPI00299049F9|nr:uncharacterized protein LOC132953048 [Metopolophium dirhodum]